MTGNGECPTLDFLRPELFAAGPLRQVGDFTTQLHKVFLIGMLQDRYQQSFLHGNGHPDMDGMLDDKTLVRPGGIEEGKGRNSLRHGCNHKGKIREVQALPGLFY